MSVVLEISQILSKHDPKCLMGVYDKNCMCSDLGTQIDC